MGSGFSKKKKQAKMLQEQFIKMQNQLKDVETEGSAGNGLVTITLNGDHEMTKITIKPDCVDPEDIEGLEDLICAAYHDALKKIKDLSMPSIPGMPDLSSFGF